MSQRELIQLFHQHHARFGRIGANRLTDYARRALLQPRDLQQVHLQTLTHQLQTCDFLRGQSDTLATQVAQLIPQTPARHLAAIRGNSLALTADFTAAPGDWQRYHFIPQLWRAAGFDPAPRESGSSQGKVRISKHGSGRLRQAIYLMTSSVVWHEPTFGIPFFERLLTGEAWIPSVIHFGRKLCRVSLALLHQDVPFVSSFADGDQAQKELCALKKKYIAENKKKKGRGGTLPPADPGSSSRSC